MSHWVDPVLPGSNRNVLLRPSTDFYVFQVEISRKAVRMSTLFQFEIYRKAVRTSTLFQIQIYR
jgi:hypothetical protein